MSSSVPTPWTAHVTRSLITGAALAVSLQAASVGTSRYGRAVLFEEWGSTAAEVTGPAVGDDLVPDAHVVATRSIDLGAPPADVFPWLAQMGWGRAGWYSYDWLDNLGRRSADRIHPEWQVRAAGEAVPAGPIAFEAAIVERPHAFVLLLPSDGRPTRRIGFSLAFDLRAAGTGTRLVTRVRIRIDAPLGRVAARLLGVGDGIMVRRQLLNIRRRVGG